MRFRAGCVLALAVLLAAGCKGSAKHATDTTTQRDAALAEVIELQRAARGATDLYARLLTRVDGLRGQSARVGAASIARRVAPLLTELTPRLRSARKAVLAEQPRTSTAIQFRPIVLATIRAELELVRSLRSELAALARGQAFFGPVRRFNRRNNATFVRLNGRFNAFLARVPAAERDRLVQAATRG